MTTTDSTHPRTEAERIDELKADAAALSEQVWRLLPTLARIVRQYDELCTRQDRLIDWAEHEGPTYIEEVGGPMELANDLLDLNYRPNDQRIAEIAGDRAEYLLTGPDLFQD